MYTYRINIGDLVIENFDDDLGIVISTVEPTIRYKKGHALVSFMSGRTQWYRWEDLYIVSKSPLTGSSG